MQCTLGMKYLGLCQEACQQERVLHKLAPTMRGSVVLNLLARSHQDLERMNNADEIMHIHLL